MPPAIARPLPPDDSPTGPQSVPGLRVAPVDEEDEDAMIDMPTTKLPALPPAVTMPGWRGAAPATPAIEPAAAVLPPAPPPLQEPVPRPRDWAHEPLPSPGKLRDLEAEPRDPPSTAEDDEPQGPSLLARLRTHLDDPYVAVMSGLSVLIVVLTLLYLFMLRS
jgi:hypothetical protein